MTIYSKFSAIYHRVAKMWNEYQNPFSWCLHFVDILIKYKPDSYTFLTQNNFTGYFSDNKVMTHLEKVHIPVWLLVSGCAVFFVPGIYFVYDKYCKDESGGPLIKRASKYLVISYLLCGLAWSIGKWTIPNQWRFFYNALS